MLILILTLSLLAMPLVTHAQAPGKIHRVGYLMLGDHVQDQFRYDT